MNQAQKDKWIADLTSGEYQQTRGALCIDTADGCKFCGNGVLLEGLGVPRTPLNGLVIDTNNRSAVANQYWFADGHVSMMTPPEFFMGVPPHVFAKIGELNDQEGWSLAEIAEYVRECVPVDAS